MAKDSKLLALEKKTRHMVDVLKEIHHEELVTTTMNNGIKVVFNFGGTSYERINTSITISATTLSLRPEEVLETLCRKAYLMGLADKEAEVKAERLKHISALLGVDEDTLYKVLNRIP